MPEETPNPKLRSRIWQGIKGFFRNSVILVSTVSAAVAAVYTRDIACSINNAETKRLEYEPLKFAHEMYDHYIKYRVADLEVKRPRVRCYRFLLENTSDDEFKAILGYSPAFNYDEARHARLKEYCLDESERKDGVIVEKMIELVNVKLGRDVAMLDGVLIGFKHPIGKQGLICENFSGFFTAGVHVQEVGNNGILGQFFDRAVQVKAIRDDNYGNLKYFTEQLKGKTGGFKRVADCKAFDAAPPPDPCEWLVARWYRRSVDWVVASGWLHWRPWAT